MAVAAAAAAPQPPAGSCSSSSCVGPGSCAGGSSSDAYFDDLTDTGGPCIVWAFKTTTGQATTPSGYVHIDALGCYCPSALDPTWK
jgi:hypothetical protein